MNRLLMLLCAVCGVVVVAGAFTACTGPAIGGGIGGVVLLVGVVLLFLLGGTTGCTPAGCTEVEPCLDMPPPENYNDDRFDVGEQADASDTGDADAEDTGEAEDTNVQPCLSPPPPDANDEEDAGTEPCLSFPPDAGDDDTDAGDEDASASLNAPADERDEILARMRDRLPEDVASRLEEEA